MSRQLTVPGHHGAEPEKAGEVVFDPKFLNVLELKIGGEKDYEA